MSRRTAQREAAILEAARRLGAERGIREITLTDIAAAVGMHKSALLRYFETREQIFLKITAEGWRDWSAQSCSRLRALPSATPEAVGQIFAATRAASRRPRPWTSSRRPPAWQVPCGRWRRPVRTSGPSTAAIPGSRTQWWTSSHDGTAYSAPCCEDWPTGEGVVPDG
ncbi:hypothetical protein GCM10010330_39840 [Streptomyces tendae]|nr:hypothetical protein GCM10010330_39840 [Streptomyces tendae]